VSCVHNVASFSGLSILDCPFGFSNVYFNAFIIKSSSIWWWWCFSLVIKCIYFSKLPKWCTWKRNIILQVVNITPNRPDNIETVKWCLESPASFLYMLFLIFFDWGQMVHSTYYAILQEWKNWDDINLFNPATLLSLIRLHCKA
jgi:hypothetical protein